MWHAVSDGAGNGQLPFIIPIYSFYSDHSMWELEPVNWSFDQGCDVHIHQPAIVWGLSPDDLFGHFVADSLITLFATMRAFWGEDISARAPAVFRNNLLLRWESWDRLW